MRLNVSSDFLKSFGKNLKAIRKDKQLSLRKLAASCNIDYSDISKMEKGEINITILTLLELSKGLDVSHKKLLDFEFEV